MEEITRQWLWVINLWGHEFTLNARNLVMTWIVVGVIFLFVFLATRRASLVPHTAQNVAEMMIEAFKGLTDESIGERAPSYFPLIMTTFIFVLISNWLGMIPFLSEPTRDINTVFPLGLIGFVVAHATSIRVKGIRRYIKGYFEPFFIMFPLNVIGELAKVISISFRLYGNIMGGAIIIIVVSELVHNWLLPPFLQFFFGFFVGTIQALVFAMLTLTYISLAIHE
mgnify:FL=1